MELALAPEHRWVLSCLGPRARDFFRQEVEDRSLEGYEARLSAIGFVGHGAVLDLACGLGQWSVALARLNEQVHGVDVSEYRLIVAGLLARSHGIGNASFSWCPMEDIRFEASRFDACFCYGAFMYGDGRRILREVWRVLKPGGRLYLSVSGAGLSLQFLWRQGIVPRQLRGVYDHGRMLLRRAAWRSSGRPYSRRQLSRVLMSHGFVVEAVADEGRVGDPAVAVQSFYPGKVYGLEGMFEILARKAGPASPVAARIDRGQR